MTNARNEIIRKIKSKMSELGYNHMMEYGNLLTFINEKNETFEVPLILPEEIKVHLKLSLSAGTPMQVACHNDPTKKKCDNCMGCSDPHCNRSHCDRTGRCQCQRTECICLGRTI